MKDSDLKKGIEGIRQLKLGRKEKDSILSNILGGTLSSPYASASFDSKKSAMGLFGDYKAMSRLWASISIAGAVATFVLYNAESALPGDMLYGVKISISEPLRGFLRSSPENMAEWESIKAIRRLDEASDLAMKGRLTEKHRADIENLFNRHVDSLESSLSEAATTTAQANFIETEFEANASARVQVFGSLSSKQAPAGKVEESGQIDETEPGLMSVQTTTINSAASSSPAATSSASDLSSSSATSASGLGDEERDEDSKEVESRKELEESMIELRKLEYAVFKKLKERKDPSGW